MRVQDDRERRATHWRRVKPAFDAAGGAIEHHLGHSDSTPIGRFRDASSLKSQRRTLHPRSGTTTASSAMVTWVFVLSQDPSQKVRTLYLRTRFSPYEALFYYAVSQSRVAPSWRC